MSNEFIINDLPLYLNPYKSQCAKCKLYNEDEATCKAFPDGIVENMLEGDITHNEPIEGQVGNYTYTPEDSE